MNQDRKDLVKLLFVHHIGLGAGKAHNHGVHRFEVRRVGHEFEIDPAIVFRSGLTSITHMVFYIATAHGLIHFGRAFKFAEDLFIGLAHDIRQYIQPATVGHPDHHFLHIILSTGMDNGIEGGYCTFPAFEGETFLTNIFGVKELFKDDAFIYFLKDPSSFFEWERTHKFFFHFPCEPVYFYLVADILELNADLSGIALLQMIQYLPERGRPQSDQVTRLKSPFHVGLIQPKEIEVKIGTPVFTLPNGIGIRDQVGLVAITQNQPVCSQFLGPVEGGRGG